MEVDKKSKVLFSIVLVLVLGSILCTFLRTMVYHAYPVVNATE